jgi:hypothetical protein
LLAACGGGGSTPAPPSPSARAGWQGPELIADLGPRSADAGPLARLSLALDPDGSATLASQRFASDQTYRPFVVRRSLAGAWQAPVLLSDTGGDDAIPSVSGGAQPVVAWQDSSLAHGGIWARCATNETWGPETLVGGGPYAVYPQVVGSACSALLFWGNRAPPYPAQWSALDPQTGWSTPKHLGTATVTRVGRSRDLTLVAFSSNGYLAWSDDHGSGGNLGPMSGAYFGVSDDPSRQAADTWLAWDSGGQILASRRVAAGFSPAQSLVPSAGFYAAVLASSRAGTLFCLARSGNTQALGCAWAAPGGDFGAFQPVPGPLGAVEADVDSQGAATLLAVPYYPAAVYAVRAQTPGRWGTPERLDVERPRKDGLAARVRADDRGRVLAVWGETSLPDLRFTLWAQRYEP